MAVIENECGKFHVDNNGILIKFEPSESNPIKDEQTTIQSNYTYTTYHFIDKLIIPEGVKGFRSNSFRSFRINNLKFPDSLESIGNENHDWLTEQSCVFADCILKNVVIPENVRVLGNYAFGHSYIEELVLSHSIRSGYGRQFKDGHILKLRLPEELKTIPHEDEKNYGWMHWYSAKVDKIEYYSE